jgi:uncharacterized membrane protein YfcA
MFVVGLIAGIGVGLLLSVLGGGGGLFIVPLLVFGLHTPVKEATGTSLAVVFAGALVGATGHWLRGNLNLRVTALFGSASMLGALGGAALHPLVADRTLLAIFAAVLVIAAGRMAFGADDNDGRGRVAPRAAILLPLGLVIGGLSGFLGVGGGFLMVPALTWATGLSLRQAVGTSLAVIALSSLSGAIGHAIQGQVSGSLLFTVGGGAVLGALIGAPISGKLPERPIRLAFSVLTLAVAVYMAVKVCSA